MATKYQEFKQLNLPAIEQAVLAKWAAEAAFEQSVALRQGATPFVFYEGPPSANGMPGIHHVISRTLKDLVCRYKTMQGFQVSRKGGWDTHGLPIELGVEKELGITKEDIGKTISVEAYNEKCREAVLRFKDKWDDLTRKMGYWVDLEQPYITYENNYIESVWWLLKKMYDKSDEQGRPLLYESISIQPYSPAAGTGLSSHELNQPGTYKMVKDTSVTAMFKIDLSSVAKKIFQENLNLSDKEALSKISNDETYFLAWTTTPWTLPSNLALTVGPRVTYSLFRTYNPYTFKACHIIIASELSSRYLLNVDTQIEGLFNPFTDVGLLITCWVKWGNEFIWDLYLSGGSSKEELSYQLSKISRLPFAKEIATFEGSLLEGLKYEQLLSYEANSVQEIERLSPGAMPFQVIVADFVTTQDGTGIVHTAPAFGADDYKVGQKYNIGILTMVDRQGRFVDGLGEFSGRYVKNYTDDKNYVDVNVDLSVKLKLENRAFKVEKYEHSYPHCWRTDKPILYYPLDAWFIRTTALKDRMVALNKTIRWKPESTGTGRFGNWLENMVDWNLSRSRFWGTPLPIWKTYHGKPESSNLGLGGSLYEICVGSV
ncbi:MAG: isoleucine--tRNA ligase, partial [Bacteroidetes bacterium]